VELMRLEIRIAPVVALSRNSMVQRVVHIATAPNREVKTAGFRNNISASEVLTQGLIEGQDFRKTSLGITDILIEIRTRYLNYRNITIHYKMSIPLYGYE
jgi:hypothetical protein